MYLFLMLLPTTAHCFSTTITKNGIYNKKSLDNHQTFKMSAMRLVSHNLKLKVHLQAYNDDDKPVESEIISQDLEYMEDEYEWIPDRDRARIIRESSFKRAEASPSNLINDDFDDEHNYDDNYDDDQFSFGNSKRDRRFTYTDEEEELISVLGGKDLNDPSPKRESGFLGDSTLKEISMDFQVPICYLADVLCGWGVPPPIDPNMILGDMITGEQAFAVLEAIHTLDVGSLNDRYSDYDLQTLCFEYDIKLSDGFELALKEGWNLPFGVKTFLRIEQEEYLIGKLAKDVW